MFEGEDTKLLSQSEGNKSRITSISFNNDGRQVAIGLDDGVVKVKHQLVNNSPQLHLSNHRMT